MRRAIKFALVMVLLVFAALFLDATSFTTLGFSPLAWIASLPLFNGGLIPGKTLFEKTVVCELAAIVALQLVNVFSKTRVEIKGKQR